ncbi:MAG TPA: FHA domain-containing protein [Thermoanaerobaculia bacterium]|jgi:hypothetical protein
MSVSLGDHPTISGHLGTIGVQDVLGFLANLRQAGALEIESADGEMTLYLDGGEVVGGRVERGAPAGPPEDGGGDRADRLTEEILRLGAWLPGAFRFFEGRTPPPDLPPVRIDVRGLLLEAARRCDDWSLLPGLYADPATRFEPLAEPHGDGAFSLTLAEWRLLYLARERRFLGEIWERCSPASPLETSRTLFGLVSARLLQRLRAAPAAPRRDLPAPADLAPPVLRPAASAAAAADEEPIDTVPVFAPAGGFPRPGAAAPRREPPRRRLSRAQIQVRRTGRLVQLVPADGERALPLAGEATALGRAADNDLILPDAHVSGHHARIVRDGEQFAIEDCRSSNGIRVDGRPAFRAALEGGEEIEIFPYRFRFEVSFEVCAPGLTGAAREP